MVNCLGAEIPPELAAVTLKLDVPVVVGVPVILPALSNESPAGNVPEETVQLMGLFDAVRVALYAAFTVPCGRVVAVTAGMATFTATFLEVGLIVKPAGCVAMATVTFALFATVIFVIVSVRVVPEPLSVPFVAPVTVMSFAVSVVGLTLKVSVNAVVVTLPLEPLAVKPLQFTAVGAAGSFTVMLKSCV